MKKICEKCGKEFEITDSEISFYKDKGYELPKRCKECRDEKSSVEVKLSGGIWKYIIAVVAMIALCFGYTIWDGAEIEQDNTDNISNSTSVELDNESDTYTFRNDNYLTKHFEKHGKEFDYETKEEYQAGANRVIRAKDVLHKIEAEDGDDIYYLEDSNEFVVVSVDGYIRTYFKPEDGIDYYNRQ